MRIATVACCVLAAGTAAADPLETTLAKDGYSLFSPTPRAMMRELSTDRPDTTESPYTVDAGHAQLEMDLASMDLARTGVGTMGLATVNAKVGLSNRMDLQLVVEAFRHEAGGASGYGDTTVRLKINLWGNDGGPTALAIMPYATFPTATGGLERSSGGGVIVPLAFTLPAGFDAALELAAEVIGGGEHVYAAGLVTATVGHSLFGPFDAFVELTAAANEGDDAELAYGFDMGVTCAIGEDLQLDLGANLVLPDPGDGVHPFLGLSYRR